MFVHISSPPTPTHTHTHIHTHKMPKKYDIYAFKGTATSKNGEYYKLSTEKKMPPIGVSAFGIHLKLDILFYPSEMATEIKQIMGVEYDSESDVYYLRNGMMSYMHNPVFLYAPGVFYIKGKYRITQTEARCGRNGIVYEIENEQGDKFALKILLDDKDKEIEMVERFVKNGLKHPSIVEYHEIFDFIGRKCIRMEYLWGRLATVSEIVADSGIANATRYLGLTTATRPSSGIVTSSGIKVFDLLETVVVGEKWEF